MHSMSKIILGVAAAMSANMVLALPSPLISRSSAEVFGPANLVFSTHEQGSSQYDSTSYASFGNAGAEAYLTTAANKSQPIYLQQLSASEDGSTAYGRLALDSSLSACVTATTPNLEAMTGFTQSACKDLSDSGVKWQTFFLQGSKEANGFSVSSIVFDPQVPAQARHSPAYKYSFFPQAHDPAAGIKAEQCSITNSNDCPAGWAFTLSFDAALKA